MSKYIDRNAAIGALINETLQDGAYGYVDACGIAKVLSVFPSETLVKCRECSKWDTVLGRNKAEYGLCHSRPLLDVTRYDDFCSKAERKPDGSD